MLKPGSKIDRDYVKELAINHIGQEFLGSILSATYYLIKGLLRSLGKIMIIFGIITTEPKFNYFIYLSKQGVDGFVK